MAMYSSHATSAGPSPQQIIPETFLLDQDAQQNLPPDSVVALQQVDSRKKDHQFYVVLDADMFSQILSHLSTR